MIRTIVITVLSIALLAIGYWGYKEYEEKNALLLHAENSYQRSFHELTYNIDLLHDKIGTSLAMNSSKRLSPQFVDIWRLTSNALTNVSQLPLSLVPLNKTEEFLSHIGEFTYRTAIRNLDDDPLTDDEVKTLETFYKEATHIKDELREMQFMTLENNLRWMDVELALATSDEQMDHTIVDGFKSVEKRVEQFSEGNDGIELIQQSSRKEKKVYLQGKYKSADEIETLSRNLFRLEDEIALQITKNDAKAPVPTYSVTYEDGKNVYMDITQKGAYPIQILVDRPIERANLSLHDGLMKASEYIEDFDYERMTPIQSIQYDDIGLFTFVHEQNDILIYPDLVTVKVALDNGDIIGLNALNYLTNHKKRSLKQPKLTSKEAEQYVSERLSIQDENLVLIENELGEEVVTYEFLGTLNDETYRIYINASTGVEEKVEKLNDTETNFEIFM